jgi:hypothetical protein
MSNKIKKILEKKGQDELFIRILNIPDRIYYKYIDAMLLKLQCIFVFTISAANAVLAL